MSCAQTGSGKTCAFLVPVLHMFLMNPPGDDPVNSNSYHKVAYPRALVLAPTRELALQILDESRKFAYRTGLRSVVVYGGQNFNNQAYEVQKGPVDILIATPGRLSDMISRGIISLSLIRYLIFDEADRMLDMGLNLKYVIL